MGLKREELLARGFEDDAEVGKTPARPAAEPGVSVTLQEWYAPSRPV
jgi:hypothetical protein